MAVKKSGKMKGKKIPVPSIPRLSKDPGVPRMLALKNKTRNSDTEKRAPGLGAKASEAGDAMHIEGPDLLSSLSSAAAAAQMREDAEGESQAGPSNLRPQKQHYIRLLHNVVSQSDVILHILDARDPIGTLSQSLTHTVRLLETGTTPKKLVYVLNKIDLIPKTNAESWLKYLRHSCPTLPFSQKKGASASPALMALLKKYKGKGSMTIGVVGYPNVGKSSIINVLKRSKACAVAAEAGWTKELKSVHLEKGIRIIDSPGVVFDEDNEDAISSVLLRNVVKVEDIPDPIAVVEQIVLRTGISKMEQLYNIPSMMEEDDSDTPPNTLEFLTKLALTSGRLLKGGTPDLLSTARQVIGDWNHQKIPYFSEPPAVHPSMIPSTVTIKQGLGESSQAGSTVKVVRPGAENVGNAEIVATFGKAFELDGLYSGRGGDDVDMAAEEVDSQDEAKMDEDVLPRGLKRPRSPSPTPTIDSGSPGLNPTLEAPVYTHRLPKRFRKTQSQAATGELGLSTNLRTQKRKKDKIDRKKERRRLNALVRATAGMEVDTSDSTAVELDETFMS